MSAIRDDRPANNLVLATSATPPNVQTIVFDLQSDATDVIKDIYEGEIIPVGWNSASFWAFLSDTVLTNVASLSNASWAKLFYFTNDAEIQKFKIGRNTNTSGIGNSSAFPRFFGLMQADGATWNTKITIVNLLRSSGLLRIHTTGTTYANGLDDTAP